VEPILGTGTKKVASPEEGVRKLPASWIRAIVTQSIPIDATPQAAIYTHSTSRIGFLALRNSRGWAIVSDPILVKYGVTYDRPTTRLSLCQKPILEVEWV